MPLVESARTAEVVVTPSHVPRAQVAPRPAARELSATSLVVPAHRDAPATGRLAARLEEPAPDPSPQRLDPLRLELPLLGQTSVIKEADPTEPLELADPSSEPAPWSASFAEARVLVPAPQIDVDARRPLEHLDVAPTVELSELDAELRPMELSDPDLPALARLDLDLDLPVQTAPSPYAHREPEKRKEVLEQMGGSAETERAVAMALDWLARHQSRDGRWDGDRFDVGCGQCRGTQRVKCDIALTGLSLLCFVAANHTHVEEGPYRDVVRRGVEWLVSQQGANGSLMGDESMYSHGIAAIALAEAYGMTGDPRLAAPVKAAADFIYDARNTHVGGWRYRPGQVGDTSVLGWQIMALTSAKRAGVEVPEKAFETARSWLELVHRPSRPGSYAYQPQREVTPAMTAEGMFVSQLIGAPRDNPRMRGSMSYILEHPPGWEPDANAYYWYYATLALFQHHGRPWQQWNEVVKDVLLSNQRTAGRSAGSWDAQGRWAEVAGRVYQTAICTLTLEVYYRYLPLYLTEPEEQP